MDKIQKNINIKNYLCHSPNKNLRLYDIVNDIWINNLTALKIIENGNIEKGVTYTVTSDDNSECSISYNDFIYNLNDTFVGVEGILSYEDPKGTPILKKTYINPYGLIISDFLIPISNLNSRNPLLSLKIDNNVKLTYNNIKTVYNMLIEYQDFKHYLCTQCKETIDEIIDTYISLYDKYFYYDGDYMITYCYNLLNDLNNDKNKKWRKYYALGNDDNSFLNYVLNNYPCYSTECPPFDLSDMVEIDVNTFYLEYIPSNEKLDIIIDLFVTYLIRENPPTEDDFDFDEFSNEVVTNVYELALEFYHDFNENCNMLPIQSYSDYEYGYHPSLKIPILINETSTNLGLCFNPIKNWEEGKKYYIGDVVYYNDKTYILRDGGDNTVKANGYYTGAYNAVENQIYFDEYEVDSNGFTTTLKMSGSNYTHWERNLGEEPEKKKLEASIESRLDSLKSFRENGIETFFDPEKKYKEGLKFNQTFIKDENGVIIEEYCDYIDKIVPYKDGYEVGHDVAEYTYVMSEHKDIKNNKIIDEGIIFTDRYHRYKVGDNDYIYNYDNLSDITYSNIQSYEEKFNKNPLIRLEYEIGISMEPTVVDDISVDRGINRRFDKHLKLAEIKSLEQLINYSNGGFYNIKKDGE